MLERWSAFSYLVTNLARFIRPDEVTFSGVNSTPPMLACLLAKQAYDFDCVYITTWPAACSRRRRRFPARAPTRCSRRARPPSSPTRTSTTSTPAAAWTCASSARRRSTVREGRTNVSAIGDWRTPKVRLPGGGGGAVMLPTARRAVTWRTEHSTRTLVERLDFVTAAGGLHGVVTPIAVFEKRDGRFALRSWHPDTSLDEVRRRTGFAFDATGAGPTPSPSSSEIDALRALDPEGQFERDANIAVR